MPAKKRASSSTQPKFTVPGMSQSDGGKVAALLQDRLNALTDLHLTLKHVHWNVVGPQFIAVHQMLDPQIEAIREMADATAERIATLGVSPVGTPGALVAARSWDDYSIGRAGASEHLGAVDVVYAGVIEEAGQLELFHWFVRAHLENSSGELATGSAKTEQGAAKRVRRVTTK
jgi:starvation-inducible DNA-binding protein